MAFFLKLAYMLSQLGGSNIRLARLLAERGRLADSLQHSERRLRELGDQIPGGAIYQHIQRPDGRAHYAYVSAGIERLFGLSAECVMADSDRFRQLIVADDRERVAAAEMQSARNLKPFDCEFRQRTVSGEVKWVQCRSMPRRLADGSTAWDGIVVDITERKRAEAAMKTTVQRFYSALSGMNGGILLVTNDGAVEFANPSFCDIFHLDDSPQDLIGLSASEIIAKVKDGYAQPEKELTRIREIVDRGQPVRGEEVVLGDGRICLRDFIPIDLGGGHHGRLWHHFDITDRKRREEQIAKLTRLYAVLSQVNEVIVRSHDAKALYSEVCRIVAETGGFPLAWIGQVQGQRVVPRAWCGSAAEYMAELKIEVDGALGSGPTGTCIRENRAVVNDDFTVNPATWPWRPVRPSVTVSAPRPPFRCAAGYGGRLIDALRG